jgi:signal transduction histidine kinase
MLRPAAESRGVELTAEQVDEDLVVRVDRGQLERTLINLGANAVKFTPRGGTAQVTACQADDHVVISVSDTGIGIPEADLSRLFDRFYRATNATAAAIPGTGLGLAIAKAIVEGHGGELGVESVEGEGTTMLVSLPLVDRSHPDEPGPDLQSSAVAQPARPGNAAGATSV